jgi:uncharacterized protein
MRVMAVGVESGALRPVLVLQEASGDHRLLPVWIGTAEANAITVEQQHVSLPRPITHQLIGDVLEALGRRLEQVRITEVRDNVFYAELILDQNTKVSARVSDAIALALHLGVAIHAEDSVLDTAAVAHTAIRSQGDERTPDEVEEFRRFLDTASPEDFDPDWIWPTFRDRLAPCLVIVSPLVPGWWVNWRGGRACGVARTRRGRTSAV